jgi:hypothetical protein
LDSKGGTHQVCGQINEIFTMSYSAKKDEPSQIHLWFEVERFVELSAADKKKHEFKNWPYVRTHIVYNSKNKKDYIQIDDIIGHGATCKLPQGCFKISKAALFVIDLSKKVSN